MAKLTDFCWLTVLVLMFMITFGTRLARSVQPQGAQVLKAALEVNVGAQRRIGDVERSMRKIADRGAVLYYLAALNVRAGNASEALRLLTKCLELGEGFDPSGSPTFALLAKSGSQHIQHLITDVHHAFPAVSSAHSMFVTEEKDLVAEGLAYDAGRDVYYLSSLNRRKIVQISAVGIVSDFVPSRRDNLLPVLGIRPDSRDGTIWANSWSEDAGQSELLHFNHDGTLLGRFSPPGAAKHGFNDLIVTNLGTVILTDSLSNQVYRFDPTVRTFSPLPLHRPLVEPNGIALAADDRSLFVADDFGVVHIDLSTGVSNDVDPGRHNTLAGADGLYWHKGYLIAIQNGIGWPRIAAFHLSQDGARVTQTTLLEYRSALMHGWPTTGAIHGDDFYFIVNGQSDNMNGDVVADPAKLEAVRIGVLQLP